MSQEEDGFLAEDEASPINAESLPRVADDPAALCLDQESEGALDALFAQLDTSYAEARMVQQQEQQQQQRAAPREGATTTTGPAAPASRGTRNRNIQLLAQLLMAEIDSEPPLDCPPSLDPRELFAHLEQELAAEGTGTGTGS